ncbi:MAG: biopolymer transporter TolR [Candidatus Cyclobacteriaceae bacterium M3_2C_046]
MKKNILTLFIFLFNFIQVMAQPVGMFSGHTDVGQVSRPGYFKYDPGLQQYYLAASGANIWGTSDQMHFAWKKMTGDFMITADLALVGEGGDPHKKAGLMIRQSLDADAPYADAILHGDGLTSLQYRQQKGGETAEVNDPEIHHATTLRIERKGDLFTVYAAKDGKPLQKIGSMQVILEGPLYAGLAVSAHQEDGFEQAIFSNVQITIPVEAAGTEKILQSNLEVIDAFTGNRKVIYSARQHFEAPNWSRDGKYFLFNSDGKMYKLMADGNSEPELLNTGFADQCNNDHGISFDGNTLAISHRSEETKNSIIYTLPVTGGVPRQVTPKGPSYWHGWSPDGRVVTYCAERNGEYDVYIKPVNGGVEQQLTTTKGLDDGPEYTYDGKYIYFNSVRTGTMQIWRMKPDGSDQEQITFDDYNDWFAHPSPDGKWIVFITYEDEVEPGSHPGNKRVMLRLAPLDGGSPKAIAYLYGGQGTINVPSWSPDGRYLAFVSYTYVKPEAK